MAINPMALMKMKERLKIFNQEHPKVGPFFQVLHERAMMEGTILELKATTPDGQEYVSNIRLTPNDVETLRTLIK
ncbi:MAG: hypothetical protein J5973_00645 [Eubacterium sp.]|nr:hypothetical protein [Eubacterium sp.]